MSHVADLLAELSPEQAEAVRIYLTASLESRRTGVALNLIVGSMTEMTRDEYDQVLGSVPKQWFERIAVRFATRH